MATQPPTTRSAPNVEQTADRQTLAIQATLRKLQQAVDNTGAPPTVLDPVAFTAGLVKTIAHKLARVPESWVVVDVTGGYGAFLRVSWDSRNITIQSQNACTAVFKVS